MQSQQLKIYAAEVGVPKGFEFGVRADIQKFVDDLREEQWWQDRYANVLRIEVAFKGTGRSFGHFEPGNNAGLISLGPLGRNVQTITHEIAHVVSNAYHGSISHDPYYAREYAVLTYIISGSASWLALQDGYEREGVNYLQDERD